MYQPINQDGHLGGRISLKHINFVEDVWYLLPITFRQVLLNGCREDVEICFSQSEGRAAILVYGLIADVEFLLPVKFRQNLFSCF